MTDINVMYLPIKLVTCLLTFLNFFVVQYLNAKYILLLLIIYLYILEYFNDTPMDGRKFTRFF